MIVMFQSGSGAGAVAFCHKPIAMTSETMPSMRSVLRALLGLMFPAALSV
jgi:hypothetical protein